MPFQLNTIPDTQTFSPPRQHPHIPQTTPHPNLQLFAGAHGHAVSSGKLEFADNVHNVAVHARAVGAMHARAQPLLHGTHSPMAFGRPFGDRLAYSHTNAEAMMHYPSSLPLDQSPHHARPTHHPDVLLPLPPNMPNMPNMPTQGIEMVSPLAHRVLCVLCHDELCVWAGYVVTSFRLISPPSLPVRSVTISRSTTFSSVQLCPPVHVFARFAVHFGTSTVHIQWATLLN